MTGSSFEFIEKIVGGKKYKKRVKVDQTERIKPPTPNSMEANHSDQPQQNLDGFEFTQEDLIAGLSSPEWRMNNLYKILDSKKRVVTFQMRHCQKYLFDNMHNRNLILKSRKLGFSTFIQLFMLDTALFSPNEACRVIAQDLSIAETIFRNTLKFAYDHLPEVLKTALPTDGDPSKTVIEFKNGSRVEVSTNARGTTPTVLHVSEFGKIAAKDPGKAREIITGSITSVAEDGLIFIESTAEGQEGEFFEMVQMAMKMRDSGKPLWKLDFKFFFYAWYQNPDNFAPVRFSVITTKDAEYFQDLEQKTGITLTPEQKSWYVKFRDTTYMGNEESMWQEQPSTPDEAFKVSMQGAYFTDQFRQIRKDGRIGRCPYDPQYPVSLFMDLGANDCTAIWFIQPKRTHYAVIDYIEESGETYSYFVNEVEKRKFVLEYVYLPHDANHRRQGGDKNQTPEEMFQDVAPHWRFWIIPRTPDKIMSIQQARNVLALCVFDESKCALGIKRLEEYRKEWNPQRGVWRATPRHDVSSNGSDAFQQFAQAKSSGCFSTAGGGMGGAFGNDFGADYAEVPDLDF